MNLEEHMSCLKCLLPRDKGHVCPWATELDALALTENGIASFEASSTNAVAREILLSIDLLGLFSAPRDFKFL